MKCGSLQTSKVRKLFGSRERITRKEPMFISLSKNQRKALTHTIKRGFTPEEQVRQNASEKRVKEQAARAAAQQEFEQAKRDLSGLSGLWS